MKNYVLILKAKNLTSKQAARLTADCVIKAKEIAPDSRNTIALRIGKKDKIK